MFRILIFLLIALLNFQPAVAVEQQLTPEQQKYITKVKTIWESLDRQQGKVTLPGGVATLNIPKTFYYLKPDDAEKILVDLWGNVPGAGKNTLGMLFPDNSRPIDGGSWGVSIDYEEDGYVSDENVDDINYSELLSDMQQEMRDASKERVKQGYEAIELIGWASKPFYEKQSHKLHWAKELKFGKQSINTLNYNIRILGRKGILLMNFIAGMDQKEIIDSNLNTVLAIAEFSEGSRYEDFIPDVDKVAAYGIGALVAGKVIAKTGLFVVLLIFLKKFGVIIAVAAVALFSRLFKRKKAE